MADKKISQLPAATSAGVSDLFLLVVDPNGTPANKRITLKNLLGALPANTVFQARVRVNANTTFFGSNNMITGNVNMTSSGLVKANNFIVTTRSTPASNNAQSEGYKPGQIFFTNTHIYVAVNATTLKRAALSTF